MTWKSNSYSKVLRTAHVWGTVERHIGVSRLDELFPRVLGECFGELMIPIAYHMPKEQPPYLGRYSHIFDFRGTDREVLFVPACDRRNELTLFLPDQHGCQALWRQTFEMRNHATVIDA